MSELQFQYLWTVALALALWWPVRQVIWVLSVRRRQKQSGVDTLPADELGRLKRRAGATSALLCLIFAFMYSLQLF